MSDIVFSIMIATIGVLFIDIIRWWHMEWREEQICWKEHNQLAAAQKEE